MRTHTSYESPLATRYASKEMAFIFSPHFKHFSWRKLWIALAKAQKTLGLAITDEQIKLMEKNADQIDFEKAAEFEKKFRHDVMAHIHAFGEQCPEAKGIIHLGATSCYVTDNTELMQMREGLQLLRSKLVQAIRQLHHFAGQNASLICLAYTHYQPAQPTTLGKRASIWLQDLMIDLTDLEQRLTDFRFLGVKGATGTQASYLELFNNDSNKVIKLEELVAKEMGYEHVFTISGQTYPRKQDMRVFSILTGIAASACKFATDIRLLANLKEVEEPFSETQVGSSAMPYKRNPMRCERICGISRFLISLADNPSYTASDQWLERTLDDSSNRRLCIPEAFLAADAILNLLIDVTSGLVVYPKIIQKHLEEELPFLATENILMASSKKGKDRQALHERLRQHSREAARKVKEEGLPSDLLERIRADEAFGLSAQELKELVQSQKFIGRAIEQVGEFLQHDVEPVLNRYRELKVQASPITL